MGYTTDFTGEFKLNKPLDKVMLEYLQKFNETRRMKRKLPPQFGEEGEYFVDGKGSYGQDHDPSVIDHNSPPGTQPGLWCQWRPNEDGTAIEWDGGEKFYNYVEWLEYIIKHFLAPADYVLNGDVHWQGEDSEDFGIIRVRFNEVEAIDGVKVYPGQNEKIIEGTYCMDDRDHKIFMAMMSNLKSFLDDANTKAFDTKCKRYNINFEKGEV